VWTDINTDWNADKRLPQPTSEIILRSEIYSLSKQFHRKRYNLT